ncbi:hypothetical protein HG536_0D03680 [Torulaspora globosa]|uniref:GIT Spa2 homology (SHD) domain-containing protein n=1 Tax=Torulaspora globosa TaxID=48254 RepID=A0A7G3ZH60_9SACH|nr:uncharacterized protein HG536_0D03680 [Torulaspora globosa]QLL32846.1 hypothetical protein HG536_0D03680 [Torulaspora globosa]
MSGSSDATIHHKDIFHYHLALRNFFQVSEIKHDRSNSPRAQKARAKLLKLSASQFYELSTDVYDELQRRLDTDQGRAEYLLPKAGFHIKRNQARQKLANLSQTRFNDLVDDILFEIKRRGYDVNPKAAEESNNVRYEHEPNAYDRSFMDNASLSNGNTINTSDGSMIQAPATATIQASQVIPKKASIDWSSEEEDDKKPDDEPSDETAEGKEPIPNERNSTTGEKIGSDSSLLSHPNPSTPVLKSFTDNYHYSDLHETPANTRPQDDINSEITDMVHTSGAAARTENEASGDPSKALQEQTDALTEANQRLTAELAQKEAEIVKLEEENKELKSTPAGSRSIANISSSTNLQKELACLSSQVSSLSIENEKLKQRISELELKAKRTDINKATDQGRNIEGFQNKYSLDPQSISKYISEDGSVPFELIKEIYDQINLLFVRIQSERDDDGKYLFEVLAHVSDAIHQMLILVDVPQFKDEVILLKASFSHAVTAVRYHAVYHSMLPKITVQAAISELAFAICNLVDSSKIKLDEPDDEVARSELSKEAGLNVSTAAPHTPIEPAFGPRLSQQVLNKPTNVLTACEDTIDEMSPVKPLKITQKANMSPDTKLKPSSSRKLSGSLLFSSMIETKSPLSSRSSKAYVRQPQVLADGTGEEDPKKTVRLDSNTKHSDYSAEREAQVHQIAQPLTPTKSVNNANVKVVDGTPSLPTPVTNVNSSAEKRENEKELLIRDAGGKIDEARVITAEPSGTTESKVDSLNKSFADKLKNFASSSGIGLRVEKQLEDKDGQVHEEANVQEMTPRGKVISGNQISDVQEDAQDRQLAQISKKIDRSPLRPPESNPTPSKLTEKFKKTFDDMTDNDIEDDSKSDFNDSSNFSDDGSTYMALRQSLRQSDFNKEGAHTIKKATVYSPRAQRNNQFTDSETRFGSDTDLSDIHTDSSQEKHELNAKQTLSEGILQKKSENKESNSSNMPISNNFDLNNVQYHSSTEPSFSTELKANAIKEKDLDESSDYQFIPLRKENIENKAANPAEIVNEQLGAQEEAEDEVDFDFDAFDIENPDNTLSELLLYLEHQTVQVISTIQSLLSSIKQPQATKGDLRKESDAINEVIRQMVDATSISMNQSRNASLKEHGSWVVRSLEDCSLRMITLCELNVERTVTDIKKDADFADKHFKQRLAGIAFDVAKCTKELVKTVEEASLKEEIAFLNSRLN